MCRMIAAVGRFSMASVIEAARAMATNANPDYEHELRKQGDAFLHDSGWGAVYRDGERLVRVRSTTPCFRDRLFDDLAGVESDLVVVHARRAKHPRTISRVNTHPFLATYLGEEWAFCHNGEVRDLSQLTWDPSLAPEGTTDSERLFYHVLTALGRGGPDSVARTLAAIRDFTCVNCFLVRPDSVIAATRRAPDSAAPRYYTMWRTDGTGPADAFTVISSEVVGVFGAAWLPVEDGSAALLARPR
jgi:predicted glutamine amidotransferase